EAVAGVEAAKLAAIKTALEQKPDDQGLFGAKEIVSKAAHEAELKCVAALELKLIAEKAATEAKVAAKADAAAQIAAEKAETELPGKLKEAEKRKDLAANRAKETAKTAEPREVTVTVYSAPINLKITPTVASSAK